MRLHETDMGSITECWGGVVHGDVHYTVGDGSVVIYSDKQRPCELVEISRIGCVGDVGVKKHGTVDRDTVLQSALGEKNGFSQILNA